VYKSEILDQGRLMCATNYLPNNSQFQINYQNSYAIIPKQSIAKQ